MFERDWVKYAALGLGVLVVALVFGAYHIGSEIGETRGERNYHTSSYERHAADEIRDTCLSGQGADVAKCIAEVINATNEHQRSEYDLVAQTEMATWAFWMLIATIIMAGITLVGVIFVWFTFKDARRIGEAEVRAYIDVTTATVNASSQKISVVLTIENQGATPAHNVKIRMGWTTEEDDLSSQAPIFEEFNIGSIGPGGVVKRSMNTDSGQTKDSTLNGEQVKSVLHNAVGFWVISKIDYETAFGMPCETNLRGKLLYMGDGDWTLSICDDGNEAT